MPLYVKNITVLAGKEKVEEVEVEGYAITHISVMFPPGCCGLVGVQIKYGDKNIAPLPEDSMLKGAGETISWDEHWVLPESPCKIKIRVKNDDMVYHHTVYVRIVTVKREQLISEQIARAIARFLQRLFGFV